MSTSTDVLDPHVDPHLDHDGIDVFGFWLYILTDCMIFACLFATYLVLNYPGAFGPQLKEFIKVGYILVGTFLLLGSNFTFGMSVVQMNNNQVTKARMWLFCTFLLGAGFVGMELYEFAHLASEGYSWHTSGAASAFFTLVGTHGLHVTVGLIWIATMFFQLRVFGVNAMTKRRMVYLGLFWNFLDLVWIFLFSVVYLMGVM